MIPRLIAFKEKFAKKLMRSKKQQIAHVGPPAHRGFRTALFLFATVDPLNSFSSAHQEISPLKECSVAAKKVLRLSDQAPFRYFSSSPLNLPVFDDPKFHFLKEKGAIFEYEGVRAVEKRRGKIVRFRFSREQGWGDRRKNFKSDDRNAGDYVIDPRYHPLAMGKERAAFFGHRVLSPSAIEVGDDQYINHAIDIFNEGLSPDAPERLLLRLAADKQIFAPVDMYINSFEKEFRLMTSLVGRQFLHDQMAHGLQTFYLHNDFFLVLQARIRFWKKLVIFLSEEDSLIPLTDLVKIDEEMRSILVRIIDDLGNLAAEFVSGEAIRHMETSKGLVLRAGFTNKYSTLLFSMKAEHFFSFIISEIYSGLPPKGIFDLIKRFTGMIADADPRAVRKMSFDWLSDLRKMRSLRLQERKEGPSERMLIGLRELEFTRPYILRRDRLEKLLKE